MQITIKDLKKSFNDKTAVDISDFTIKSGEILGLVGNNGAGKTTLFRLFLDLLKSDEGNVVFKYNIRSASDDGVVEKELDPTLSEDWKTVTGCYLDEGFLIDFLTPEEYFAFIAKVNSISDEELNERLKTFEHFMNGEIMEQKKLIRNFSAGNKQKIGIISALLNRPQLLVLDEPFNFLDPSSQNALKNILVSYNKDTDATILISSHNLQHTVDISTRVALLEHGVIIKSLANENGSVSKELEDYFNVK